MNKQLLFLDFDSTLFDTPRFFEDLIYILAEEYGLDPNTYRQEEHNYRDETGSMYDFFSHIAQYTQDPADAIVQKVWPKLKKDYIFDDARKILNNKKIREKSQIVTLGYPQYQHLKLALAGLLDYPHTIIQEPKIPYIEAKYPFAEKVTLIDDRAFTFDYPATKPIELFQIVRYSHQPKTKNPNVRIISSFDELDFKD